MRIVLKPISHPDLGDIDIDDDLFPIGRREQPFSSMENAASQLSRRHARIFTEGGTAYIVDLGSTNGTQVQGRQLDTEPAALHNGDEVVFGGQLSYRVAIEDDATVTVEAPPVRLVLNPLDEDLDPLVIENFPFLVARNDEWIQRYEEQFPEDLKEISRRHAIVVLKGSRIYVEDLDSANGTFVSGSRLDELARALEEGDTLSFGTSRFVYRVHLEPVVGAGAVTAGGAGDGGAQTEARLAETAVRDGADARGGPDDLAATIHDNPKTIYLNADPTSFVHEVYAHLSEPSEAETADEAKEGASVGPVGRLAKARAVSRELGSALETSSPKEPRIWYGLLAFFAVLAVVLGANHWLGADRRQVETLLNDEAYAASAMAANAYLEDRPDDAEVELWGARAVVNAVVPEWLRLIEDGDFEGARAWVRGARERHSNLRRGAELLTLLEWATRMEAHLAVRSQGPVSLFEAEEEVRGIVDDWEHDAYANRRLISQLADYVSAFSPSEARLMSALRTLQNDSSLYLEAITELRGEIIGRLDEGQTAAVASLITEFEVRYPEVTGTEKLYADLGRYEQLLELMEQRELLAIRDMRRSGGFSTALFSQHVDALLEDLLPPPDVIASIELANELWLAGDLSGATTAYQSLSDTEWNDVAERDIQRMHELSDGYHRLQGVRGDPDYTQQLLAYRQQLKPGRDDYFIEELRTEIAQQEQVLLSTLESSARVARAEWEAYGSDGGIPGVVRLQQSLTERFRDQALRLETALTKISEATDGYELMYAQPPGDWLALRSEIVNEIGRQRRALEDLKRVMGPALVDSKLALIPQVKEVIP